MVSTRTKAIGKGCAFVAILSANTAPGVRQTAYSTLYRHVNVLDSQVRRRQNADVSALDYLGGKEANIMEYPKFNRLTLEQRLRLRNLAGELWDRVVANTEDGPGLCSTGTCDCCRKARAVVNSILGGMPVPVEKEEGHG